MKFVHKGFIKKGALYFLVSVGILIALIGTHLYFSIRTIAVDGVSDLKGIEQYSDSFLPLVNEKRVQNELQVANPSITSIEVFKQYPSTLFISARRLRPIVAVKLADGYMYISEEGTVLEKNRSEDTPTLPILTYYQPLFFNQAPIGSTVDHEEVVSASQLTNMLLDLGIRVTKIDITNENMILLHTDTFNIVATSIKSAEDQFEVFSYTYAQLRREGKEYTHIDVRFEKPIIKL